jgi:hypothetical protein
VAVVLERNLIVWPCASFARGRILNNMQGHSSASSIGPLSIFIACGVILVGCGWGSKQQEVAKPEATAQPAASVQKDGSQGKLVAPSDAPVTVSASPKFPTGPSEVEIAISNRTTDVVRFKYALTRYYADGQLWFTSTHSVNAAGDVSVAYTSPTGEGERPAATEYSFKVPVGQTLRLTAQVRNNNFEVGKKRYIEVALITTAGPVYGPFDIDFPNPLTIVKP